MRYGGEKLFLEKVASLGFRARGSFARQHVLAGLLIAAQLGDVAGNQNLDPGDVFLGNSPFHFGNAAVFLLEANLLRPSPSGRRVAVRASLERRSEEHTSE